MSRRFDRLIQTGPVLDRRELTEIQKRLENAVNPVVTAPWNNGILLDVLALVAGQVNLISHSLGRAWRGWEVVDQDAAAIISRDATSTQPADKFLPLLTTVNVNARLVVW